MKRQKIVAGNWKMNCTRTEATELVRAILLNCDHSGDTLNLLFPPFPFLTEVCALIQEANNFKAGAQNCSAQARGAYTGEVSADMIRSCGASYVIVGHSERRQYFNEQPKELRGKIQQALASGLKVIFCFGEQLSDRRAGNHFQLVKTQITDVLSGFTPEQLTNLVLAYEPVWAIGTGETASPEQAQSMHAHVRKVLSDLYSTNLSDNTNILYGGSCNAQNAKELFSCPDVDGGLIGGASLKADEFCKIMASF
ncbi:MAG TPA: triose-phosphate isomerase [Bacteroidia bacterium]|nr:triose-phosphate isomerase [Bacteroidia bacterium]